MRPMIRVILFQINQKKVKMATTISDFNITLQCHRKSNSEPNETNFIKIGSVVFSYAHLKISSFGVVEA